MDNKYDSFTFRIKLNVNLVSELTDMIHILPDPKQEEDLLCTEEIRLKFG